MAAYIKEELSSLLEKKEFKAFYSSTNTLKSVSKREELVDGLKNGAVFMTPLHFVQTISLLLTTEADLHSPGLRNKLNYTMIYCSQKALDKISASRHYLASLDDSGAYWGLTEVGPVKKTLEQWIVDRYTAVCTTIMLNYEHDDKLSTADPRIWHISDCRDGVYTVRTAKYQPFDISLFKLHADWKEQHRLLNQIEPERPRIIHHTALNLVLENKRSSFVLGGGPGAFDINKSLESGSDQQYSLFGAPIKKRTREDEETLHTNKKQRTNDQ